MRMRTTSYRVAIASAAWFGIIAAVAMPAHAQDWVAAAQTHMSRLEDELAQRGPAQIDADGVLTFGTTTIDREATETIFGSSSARATISPRSSPTCTKRTDNTISITTSTSPPRRAARGSTVLRHDDP
jgi:hypothetical protein